MRFKKNKKASIQDVIYIMIALIVVSVGFLIGYKIYHEINSNLQANDIISGNAKASTASNSIENLYPGVIDNSFMLLVVGLCIAAIALAMMVRIHPIFFVFFLIIFFIIIFLAGVFSNIYQGISDTPEFSELSGNLVYISHIMQFLPFIVGVMGFTLSFVMYKTWQNS